MSKTLRSFLIGAAGALIVFIPQWASSHDFGPWNAIIVPAVAMLVDLLRRSIPVESKR